MRRGWSVLFVLLSTSGAALGAAAQQDATPSGRETGGFSLEQNYPNPFNPETRIPFTLGEDLFAEGQPIVVSIRIYNLLQQFVAAPTALRHPAGEGVPILQLEYTQPGSYAGYWDGTDQNGIQVASGVYFVQLTVNSESKHRRMFVTK